MLSDNTGSGDSCVGESSISSVHGSETAEKTQSMVPQRSELLCFIKDKQRSIAFDDLAKICLDFYREDEIITARNKLEFVIADYDVRLPKRQGTNKLRSTMDDMFKVLLNPSVRTPDFYALDLSRLPPVDLTHCDASAILLELQGLRREVRELRSIKDEVDNMKQNFKEFHNMRDEINEVKQTVIDLVQSTTSSPEEYPPIARNHTIQVGSLESAGSLTHNVRTSVSKNQDKALYSHIAAQLKPDAIKTSKPVIKSVIGNSEVNKCVKAVMTTRTVDVFVSRLHPTTKDAELIDSVKSIVSNFKIFDVTCDKLMSKFKELYSSYHIQIRVDRADFKNAIDIFMSPAAWPTGVLVRRYFKPKNVVTQQS